MKQISYTLSYEYGFGKINFIILAGFFMYQFSRQVLDWGASEYGYWITYRNLLAALGT